ncbi:DoxX family protein [Salininema proteolyticum]|uniref:DoxX family protein n=1 Tax=Salininema proteolyticum TaxID=1607685 RepID=A0ABV8U4S3_9ACTN
MYDVASPAFGIFLILVGCSHFLFRGYFRGLVPSWMPAKTVLVIASGATEIGLGAMMFFPDLRFAASLAAVLLISGYMVSHLDAARQMSTDGDLLLRPPVVAARIVVNLGYIAWAGLIAWFSL